MRNRISRSGPAELPVLSWKESFAYSSRPRDSRRSSSLLTATTRFLTRLPPPAQRILGRRVSISTRSNRSSAYGLKSLSGRFSSIPFHQLITRRSHHGQADLRWHARTRRSDQGLHAVPSRRQWRRRGRHRGRDQPGRRCGGADSGPVHRNLDAAGPTAAAGADDEDSGEGHPRSSSEGAARRPVGSRKPISKARTPPSPPRPTSPVAVPRRPTCWSFDGPAAGAERP